MENNEKKIMGISIVIGTLIILSGCSQQQDVVEVQAIPENNVVDAIVIDETLVETSTDDTVMVVNSNVDRSEKEFVFTAFSGNEGGSFAPRFSLDKIEVNKGDRVVLKITNTKGTHDIMIQGYDVYAATPLDEEVVIEFIADTAGEFEYYCTVGSHRAAGMWGTLVVLDN